jgi:hypothetical protein
MSSGIAVESPAILSRIISRPGPCSDLDPSPAFNAAEYRRRHLGRASRQFRRLMHPERDNPLVHHLRADYR